MQRSRKRPPQRRYSLVLLTLCVLVVVGVAAFLLHRNSSGPDPADSVISAESIAATPSPTATPSPSPSPSPEPEESWNLILVNQTHAIPENWDQELVTLANGTQVDSRIYPDLQQMFDDMRAQGVYPVVASGYRTAEKQQSLMDEKIQEFEAQGYSAEDAATEAKLWVNPVGYSEHQTGLAVDINADGINSSGEDVYNWLAEHAWEYGFILRYPDGKTDITGTDYEPWHYRYVGKDAAAEIQTSGQCLEEYLGQ